MTQAAFECTPEADKCEYIPSMRSPLKWLGGKYRLSARIIKLMPRHVCYVEPFCGAASCLFRKSRSRVEVLNDRNGELVNFFRVLARFPQWFEYKARYALHSRRLFDELKNTDPATLSEEDRAWRFYYLNRLSFGGKNVSFGTQKHFRGTMFSHLHGHEPVVLAAWQRLRNVMIENLNYDACIRLYDSKDAFFYLDPPYWQSENAYGAEFFSRDDFEKLAGILEKIEGRFILSINDCQQTRDLFGKFSLLGEINVKYTIKREDSLYMPELLYGNYQP